MATGRFSSTRGKIQSHELHFRNKEGEGENTTKTLKERILSLAHFLRHVQGTDMHDRFYSTHRTVGISLGQLFWGRWLGERYSEQYKY